MSRKQSERSSADPLSQTDPELEREIAEALGDHSVEELLEEAAVSEVPAELSSSPADGKAARPSGDASRRADSDQFEHPLRRGRISAIHGDDVFVDLTGSDGKNQGIVPLAQFDRPPRVGSIMDFVIERHDEAAGLIHLSREGAISQATWDQLHKGSAVEARVTGSNKGGLELEMVGSIRAFMPASQIDIHHVDDLECLVGQKVHAIVHEIDHQRKRVLLSRRAYLERERERLEKKLWEGLEVGQELQGTVRTVMDYGAFVDIGGADGLVHVSDLRYGHVDKPADVVKVGEQVTVKVLKLDPERKRISLGIKQVQPNPWETMAGRLKPGDYHSARVVRVANFGAFVEIESGVEGLVPASELSWKRVGNPSQVVQENQVLRLVVLQVDPEKQRLTLSLKQAEGDPWVGAEHQFPRDSVVEGVVVRTTDFGAFIEIKPGVEGLVHISELSDKRVDKVENVLEQGQREKFRVLEVDEQERRIRLSLKRADQPLGAAASHAPARNDRPTQSRKRRKPENLEGGMGQAGGMGMGLGDLKLPVRIPTFDLPIVKPERGYVQWVDPCLFPLGYD